MKIKERRTQVFENISSCPFVSSSDTKRPPKFNSNIIMPMKYGFELILARRESNGLIGIIIPPTWLGLTFI